MTEKERYDAKKNAVTYMSDELGLHKMANPNQKKGTISLHLYSPPFQNCQASTSNIQIKSFNILAILKRRPFGKNYLNILAS